MTLLANLRAAVANEIKAQRRTRHAFWVIIDRIDLLREHVGSFIYRLELGQELRIVSDTELAIKVPGQSEIYTVQVLLSDGQSLVVVSKQPLPQQISLVRFQFNPTFILEQLARDLTRILNPPSALLHTLLTQTLPAPNIVRDSEIRQQMQRRTYSLNGRQRDAVVRMQADQVHILWGPPGTGKTSTLGASIMEHLHAGKTCLLLSTSNAAVDEMVKATVRHFGPQALTTIFRTGVSADTDVEHLTSIGYFRRRNPQLAAQADQAQARLKSLTAHLASSGTSLSSDRSLRDIQTLKATVNSYVQEAKLYGDDVLGQAPCVSATLASLVINPRLAERTFDVVYIDEASIWTRFWTLVQASCTHISAHAILAAATRCRDIAHGLQALSDQTNIVQLPCVYVESPEFPCPPSIENLFHASDATTKLVVRRKRGSSLPAGITQRHDAHGTVPSTVRNQQFGPLAGPSRGRMDLSIPTHHLLETPL